MDEDNFAILGQDERGLHWLANAKDMESAHLLIEMPGDKPDFGGKEYDAILIVPLAGFVSAN